MSLNNILDILRTSKQESDKTGKKATIYSFVLTIASKIITYFLLLVFANLFILDSYGKASFVLSIFKIIMLVSAIGLPYVFVPWYIQKRDSVSVVYFLLITTIIITIIGAIFSLKYIWILPLVLTLPLILLSNIGQSFLRIKHKYHLVQLFNLLFIIMVFVSVYLLRNLEEAGIIYAHAIAYFITSSAIILLNYKSIKTLFKTFKINFKEVSIYFKKGLITSLLYLSFYFLNWIDSTILGFLSTFENVARYNVAGPVSNVITAIPLTLSMFLLTRSSEIKEKKHSRQILKRAIRISYSLSILSAIVIASLIFWIVKIFFPKYIGIEIYVIILLVGILFYTVYSLYYTYLMGKLKPERALVPIAGAALLNIILDIILIPKFGLYGITFATTFAHSFALIFLSMQMRTLKQTLLIFLLAALIPLGYYMDLYGLLLLPIACFVLHKLELIKISDIKVVLNTVRNILSNH